MLKLYLKSLTKPYLLFDNGSMFQSQWQHFKISHTCKKHKSNTKSWIHCKHFDKPIKPLLNLTDVET